MPINGKIGSISVDSERAQIPGNAIVRTGKLKADDGVYPAGLLLTRKDGVMEQLQVVDNEEVATGDGATKAITGTLEATPVQPGSVTITDGVETFHDDGLGRLIGDQGGEGEIFYGTGDVSPSFNAAPAEDGAITASYCTTVSAVLDVAEDTTQTDDCEYVAQGQVQGVTLKVGAEDQAVPTEEILGHLEAAGIYPV